MEYSYIVREVDDGDLGVDMMLHMYFMQILIIDRNVQKIMALIRYKSQLNTH
jgi:hypothetical protein